MPMNKLKLLPGVDVEETPTYNAAQISVSMLIRYYAMLPQKRSGWQQMTDTPIVGTGSGLHGWADIEGNPYLAVGTDQRLEVLIGGVLGDITPLDTTTNPAVAFSTTNGSNEVTINDPGYHPAVGDWIRLRTYVSVGGTLLFSFYQVTSEAGADYTVDVVRTATATVVAGGAVPLYTTTNLSAVVLVTLNDHGFSDGDTYRATVLTTVATVDIFGTYSVTVVSANTFNITAASAANASTSASENAGNARIEYMLPSGLPADTPASGWGTGLWGGGLWGSGSGSGAINPMRQWSLDNFGEDLIASPTNGEIYYWTPPDPSPALVVGVSAPDINTMVFVNSQARIVFAIGSEVGGVHEPLLMRWSDVDDFTDWTPTTTNQAGSYFVPQGSKLVGGVAVGLGALVWTDVGVTQVTYQGLPFIFSIRPLAMGCGLMNQRAVAVIGPLVMWLSNHGFFLMTLGGGGPTPIECSVWDILVNNWDLGQPGQFVLGANELSNEFELFFPLASTSEFYVADSVTRGSVKYNFIEKVWDYSITAQLQRTAWQGHWTTIGGNTGNPVGTDLDGLLQQHEIGYDANGEAMAWMWQTGFFDLSEGSDMIFVDWLIPDFVTIGDPTISLEVLMQDYPNGSQRTAGPFLVQPSTPYVPKFGARGRQAAIRVSGQDLGTFNRLGALRYQYAPDGKGP